MNTWKIMVCLYLVTEEVWEYCWEEKTRYMFAILGALFGLSFVVMFSSSWNIKLLLGAMLLPGVIGICMTEPRTGTAHHPVSLRDDIGYIAIVNAFGIGILLLLLALDCGTPPPMGDPTVIITTPSAQRPIFGLFLFFNTLLFGSKVISQDGGS